MSVEYVTKGSVVNGTATTLSLVAPTLIANDIIIAQICTEDNDALSVPSADWITISELNGTAATLRNNTYYKRAVAADSGATFTWTGLAGTAGNMGILTVYRGARVVGAPIGNISSVATATATTVTYATLTPRENASTIVVCGHHGIEGGTAGAITTTAPSAFTNVVAESSGAAENMTIYQYWGNNNVGGATGGLTHTTSVATAISTGVLFEILSEGITGGFGVGTEGRIVYPRLNRRGIR